MFRDAVSYPTTGDDGVGAVLIAGGLLMIAALLSLTSVFFLFLPLFVAIAFHVLVRGYYIRVMRWTTRQPDADAPPFDDWGELLKDGLQAALVALFYWIPALGLFAMAILVAGLSGIPEPGTVVDALSTVTGLLVLAGGLYLVGILYLLPAAVANFAYHDDFSAAFEVRELVEAVLTEDYAVRWVFTMVYQIVAWPFVLLLYLFLVGFFARAHVGISVRRVYGHGLRDGLDLEPRPIPALEPDEDAGEDGQPATRSDEAAGGGFVDLGDLVEDPSRPRGVPGPAADDEEEWTDEFRERVDDEGGSEDRT